MTSGPNRPSASPRTCRAGRRLSTRSPYRTPSKRARFDDASAGRDDVVDRDRERRVRQRDVAHRRRRARASARAPHRSASRIAGSSASGKYSFGTPMTIPSSALARGARGSRAPGRRPRWSSRCGSWPAMTRGRARRRRRSRRSTPIWSSDDAKATSPKRLTRPYVGLTPTTPQNAAGCRTEPPVSEPSAIGTMPAATAAAEPPDEPPGTRSGVERIARRADTRCSRWTSPSRTRPCSSCRR